MADNINANKITADSVETGTLQVSGSARFANGINATINNGQDINKVTSSNLIRETDYILVSDGTSLRKVAFSDILNMVKNILDARNDLTYLTPN